MSTILIKIPWQVCYYSCHGHVLVEVGWLSKGMSIRVGPTEKFMLRHREVEASSFWYLGQTYYVVAQNLGEQHVREKVRKLADIHLVVNNS